MELWQVILIFGGIFSVGLFVIHCLISISCLSDWNRRNQEDISELKKVVKTIELDRLEEKYPTTLSFLNDYKWKKISDLSDNEITFVQKFWKIRRIKSFLNENVSWYLTYSDGDDEYINHCCFAQIDEKWNAHLRSK